MLIPPALILIFGGIVLFYALKYNENSKLNHIVKFIMLAIPLITLAMAWMVIMNQRSILASGDEILPHYVHFAGFSLQPLFIHQFTPIFATIFCLAAFSAALFGFHTIKPAEIAAGFVYAGGAVGVTFSGDLLTLFIYWELMAIGSTIVVFCGGKKAEAAGMRYAYMHFLGGVIFLIGITAYQFIDSSYTITSLAFDLPTLWNDLTKGHPPLASIATLFIFLGILINTAAPPFSAWLADAYPEASPVGAVFLSAFTTKTAVFVLLTLFAGTEILIVIGLFMVFYGIIYAMLENDCRRILSYSIINQVGFMVTGIGIGTDLALYGVAAHAFCHIIYKALLFMSAGSVMHMTGKTRCTDLGGLWLTMRITTACGIIGALAISAFPWTSGFVSKSMISSSAAEQHMMIVWLLLMAASAGVFLHAGIKFPWFVFFQKDAGLRPTDPPLPMKAAMVFLAFMCILPGLFPNLLYALLPELEQKLDYHAYSASHIISQLQLLMFGGLAFFVLLPMLKRTETLSLDFDWVYRVPMRIIGLHLEKISYLISSFIEKSLGNTVKFTENFVLKYHAPTAIFARSWQLGRTLIYAALLLLIFLLINYRIA